MFHDTVLDGWKEHPAQHRRRSLHRESDRIVTESSIDLR